VFGRKVGTALNERLSAGRYSLDWKSSKLTSGMYMYSMTQGSARMTKNFLVVD
jgi:hypothetical protein